MTLKFSRNAKVTRALTGRCPVRPAADDDFEIVNLFTCLKHLSLKYLRAAAVTKGISWIVTSNC